MSYNIDTFKLKSISGLRIPLASLYKCERKDWHPQRINNDDGTVSFVVAECDEVHGTIDGETFICTRFECYGDGSGTAMNWVYEPAFKESTGSLVASCVWEGGDTINQLIVEDGKVSWIDIEI